MDDGGRGGNADEAVNVKRVKHCLKPEIRERQKNDAGAEECKDNTFYKREGLLDADRQKRHEQRGNIDVI